MSNIEWTEQTWNPIIGCSKISPGCDNCYAEKMAGRLAMIPATYPNYARVVKLDEDGPGYKSKGEWNGTTHFVESALNKPLNRKKPTTYFVCSMGDLFHESVAFHWFEKVMDVIEKCPQHTFQILTKRSSRMRKLLDHWYFGQAREGKKFPLPNLWLGVTVENQEQANKRIPHLLSIPAAVKFVSVEPMLGPIDFYDIVYNCEMYHSLKGFGDISGGDFHILGGPKLDWVICGGESGPNARPLHPDWVRSIRDQCKDANTPFFFKQWGEWKKVGTCGHSDTDARYYNHSKCQVLNINGGQGFHGENAIYVRKVGKKKAGSLLDGVHHKDLPIK